MESTIKWIPITELPPRTDIDECVLLYRRRSGEDASYSYGGYDSDENKWWRHGEVDTRWDDLTHEEVYEMYEAYGVIGEPK